MVEQTTLHNVLTCVIAVVIFIFQSLNYLISWIKNYVKHREKTIPVVTADTTISSDSQPNDNNTLEHFIRVRELIQKHLDIPLIIAEDEPKVDGLTEHYQLSSSNNINKEKDDLDQFVDHLIDDSYVARGLGLITATVGRPTDFYLYSKHDSDFENIEIEIKGRSGEVGKITVLNPNPVTSEEPNSILVDYSYDKDRLKVTYTPCAEGVHTLTLLKYGVSICRSPYYISVEKSPTNYRSRIRLGTKKYKMVTKFGKGKFMPIETKDNNVPVLAPGKDKYTPIETKSNNIPVIVSNKPTIESSNRPKSEEIPMKMDVMSIVTKFESKSMNSKIMPQKRMSCIVERSSEGDFTDTSPTTFNEQSKIKTSNINDTNDNILNSCKSINRKYSSETNSQEKELDDKNTVKAEDDQKDKSITVPDTHIKIDNDIIENENLSSNLQELTSNETSTNTLKHKNSREVEKHDKTTEINDVLKEQNNIDIHIEPTEDQTHSDYTDAESFNIQNEISYFDDEDRKTVVVVENNANELESSSNDLIAHKITTSTQYDINTLPLANIITKITDSVCTACSKQVFSILSSFPKDLNIKHDKNTNEKRSVFETFLSQPIRININIDNVYDTPNISAQKCNSTHLDTVHNINSEYVDNADTSIKDSIPNEIESLGNNSREFYQEINNADTELKIDKNKNDREIISTSEENKIDAITLISSEYDVKNDEICQSNNEHIVDEIIMQKCSTNEEIFPEQIIDLVEPNKCNEIINEKSINSSEENSPALITNDLFTINDIENINITVNEEKLKIVNHIDESDKNLELESNILDDTVSTKEASNIIPLDEGVCNERNHEQSTSNLYETDNDNFVQTTIQDEDQTLMIEKLIGPILQNYLKSNMIKKALQSYLKKGLSKASDTQTFENIDVNPLNELQKVTLDNNTLITEVNIENEGGQIVTNETPITQMKNHIDETKKVETVSNNEEINNNMFKIIEQIIKTNMTSKNKTETVDKIKINNIVHTIMHLNDQQKNCNNIDSSLEKDTSIQEDITDITILNNDETIEVYKTKDMELEKLDDILTANKTVVSLIGAPDKEQNTNTTELQKLNETLMTNELGKYQEKTETKSEITISNDTGIILEEDKNTIKVDMDTNFNFPISNKSENSMVKEYNEVDEVSNLPEIPLLNENNTSIIESKIETEIVNNFKDLTIQNTCSQENTIKTPNKIECDSIETLNTVKNQNDSDLPTPEAIKNNITPDVAETKTTQNVNETNITTLTLINTEPTSIESEFKNTNRTANMNETKTISDKQTDITSDIKSSQYDNKTNDTKLVTIEKETRIKLPSLNVREIIIIEKPNLKDETTTSGELISSSISTVKIELDTSNTQTSNATILLSINKSNIVIQENTSTLRILDQIETDMLKDTNQVNTGVESNDNDTKNETIKIDTLTENTLSSTSNNPNALKEYFEQTEKTEEHTISSDLEIAKIQNSSEITETPIENSISTKVSTKPIQNPKNDEIVNIITTENEVLEASVTNVTNVEKNIISLTEPTKHSKEEENQYKPMTINAIDNSITSEVDKEDATGNLKYDEITVTPVKENAENELVRQKQTIITKSNSIEVAITESHAIVQENISENITETIILLESSKNENENEPKNIITRDTSTTLTTETIETAESTTDNIECKETTVSQITENLKVENQNANVNPPCNEPTITLIEKSKKELIQEDQTMNIENDCKEITITESQKVVQKSISDITKTEIMTLSNEDEKKSTTENVIVDETFYTPTTETTKNSTTSNLPYDEIAVTSIEENLKVYKDSINDKIYCGETSVTPTKENSKIDNQNKTDTIQCGEIINAPIEKNSELDEENTTEKNNCDETTVTSIEETVEKESVKETQTLENGSTGVAENESHAVQKTKTEITVSESQTVTKDNSSEDIKQTEILTELTKTKTENATVNIIVPETSNTNLTELTKEKNEDTTDNLPCDQLVSIPIEKNSEQIKENTTDNLPSDVTAPPIKENVEKKTVTQEKSINPENGCTGVTLTEPQTLVKDNVSEAIRQNNILTESTEAEKETEPEKTIVHETSVKIIEDKVEKKLEQQEQKMTSQSDSTEVIVKESQEVMQQSISENVTKTNILTETTENIDIGPKTIIVNETSTTSTTETPKENKKDTKGSLPCDEKTVSVNKENSQVNKENTTDQISNDVTTESTIKENIQNESVTQEKPMNPENNSTEVNLTEQKTIRKGIVSENITQTNILTESTEDEKKNEISENEKNTSSISLSDEKAIVTIEDTSEVDKKNTTDESPCKETAITPIEDNAEKESEQQEQIITLQNDSTEEIVNEPQEVVQQSISENVTPNNTLLELTECNNDIVLDETGTVDETKSTTQTIKEHTDDIPCDEPVVMPTEENIEKESVKQEKSMSPENDCTEVELTEQKIIGTDIESKNKTQTNITTESTEGEKDIATNENKENTTGNSLCDEKVIIPTDDSSEVDKENTTDESPCNETTVTPIEDNAETESEQEEQIITSQSDSTKEIVNETLEVIQQSISENVTQNNTLLELTEGRKGISLETVTVDENLNTPITEKTKENKTDDSPCDEPVVMPTEENIEKETVKQEKSMNPENVCTEVDLTDQKTIVTDIESENITHTISSTESTEGEKNIATSENEENTTGNSLYGEKAIIPTDDSSEVDRENTTDESPCNETAVMPIKDNAEKESEQQEQIITTQSDSSEVIINESQEVIQQSISENVTQNNTLIELTEGSKDIELDGTVTVDESSITSTAQTTKENNKDTKDSLQYNENAVSKIQDNSQVTKENTTDQISNDVTTESTIKETIQKESVTQEKSITQDSNCTEVDLTEQKNIILTDIESENITQTITSTESTEGEKNVATNENEENKTSNSLSDEKAILTTEDTSEVDKDNTTDESPCNKTAVTPIEDNAEKESEQEEQIITAQSDSKEVIENESQEIVQQSISENVTPNNTLLELTECNNDIVLDETGTVDETKSTTQTIKEHTDDIPCDEPVVMPTEENIEKESVKQEKSMSPENDCTEVNLTEQNIIITDIESENIIQTNITTESAEGEKDIATNENEENTTGNSLCDENAIIPTDNSSEEDKENKTDVSPCNETAVTPIEDNTAKESEQEEQIITLQSDSTKEIEKETLEVIQQIISENVTQNNTLLELTEGSNDIILDETGTVDEIKSTAQTIKEHTDDVPCNEAVVMPTEENIEKESEQEEQIITLQSDSTKEVENETLEVIQQIISENVTQNNTLLELTEGSNDIILDETGTVDEIKSTAQTIKEHTDDVPCDEAVVMPTEENIEKESVTQEKSKTQDSNCTEVNLTEQKNIILTDIESENITQTITSTELTEGEKNIATNENGENTSSNSLSDEKVIITTEDTSEVDKDNTTDESLCNETVVTPIEDNAEKESEKQEQIITLQSDSIEVILNESQEVVQQSMSENVTQNSTSIELTDGSKDITLETINVDENLNTPITETTKENKTDNFPCDEPVVKPIEDNTQKESVRQEKSMSPENDSTEVDFIKHKSIVTDNESENITQTNISTESTEGEGNIATNENGENKSSNSLSDEKAILTTEDTSEVDKDNTTDESPCNETVVTPIEDNAEKESEQKEQIITAQSDSKEVIENESQEIVQQSIPENVTLNNSLIELTESKKDIVHEAVTEDKTSIKSTEQTIKENTDDFPCDEPVVIPIESNTEKEAIAKENSLTQENDCTEVNLTEQNIIITDIESENIIQTNITTESTEGEKYIAINENEENSTGNSLCDEKVIIPTDDSSEVDKKNTTDVSPCNETAVTPIEDNAEHESEQEEQIITSQSDLTKEIVNETLEVIQQSISENVTQNNTLLELTEGTKDITLEIVTVDENLNTPITETTKENKTDNFPCDEPVVMPTEENIEKESVSQEKSMSPENVCTEVDLTEQNIIITDIESENITQTITSAESTEGEKNITTNGNEENKTSNLLCDENAVIATEDTSGIDKKNTTDESPCNKTAVTPIEDNAENESEQEEQIITTQSDSTEVIINESQEVIQQSISENVTQNNILLELTEGSKDISLETVTVDETLTTPITETTKENRKDTNGNLPCNENGVTVIKDNSEVDKEKTTDQILNYVTAESSIKENLEKESITHEQSMTPENKCTEVVLTEPQTVVKDIVPENVTQANSSTESAGDEKHISTENVILNETSSILTSETTKENNEETTSNLSCTKITATAIQENVEVNKENTNNNIEHDETSGTLIEDTSEVDKENSTDITPCDEPALTIIKEHIEKVSTQEEQTMTLIHGCKEVPVTESQVVLQGSISEDLTQIKFSTESTEVEEKIVPEMVIVHDSALTAETIKVNKEDTTDNFPCDENAVTSIEKTSEVDKENKTNNILFNESTAMSKEENLEKESVQQEQMISQSDFSGVAITESQVKILESKSDDISQTTSLLVPIKDLSELDKNKLSEDCTLTDTLPISDNKPLNDITEVLPTETSLINTSLTDSESERYEHDFTSDNLINKKKKLLVADELKCIKLEENKNSIISNTQLITHPDECSTDESEDDNEVDENFNTGFIENVCELNNIPLEPSNSLTILNNAEIKHNDVSNSITTYCKDNTVDVEDKHLNMKTSLVSDRIETGNSDVPNDFTKFGESSKIFYTEDKNNSQEKSFGIQKLEMSVHRMKTSNDDYFEKTFVQLEQTEKISVDKNISESENKCAEDDKLYTVNESDLNAILCASSLQEALGLLDSKIKFKFKHNTKKTSSKKNSTVHKSNVQTPTSSSSRNYTEARDFFKTIEKKSKK